MRNAAIGVGLMICSAAVAVGHAHHQRIQSPATTRPAAGPLLAEARDSSSRLFVVGPYGRSVFFVARVRGGTVRTLRIGAVAMPDSVAAADSAIAMTPAVLELSPGTRWLQLETRRRDQAVRPRPPDGQVLPWGRLLTLRREGERWLPLTDVIPAEQVVGR